jgi:hypothetical protein
MPARPFTVKVDLEDMGRRSRTAAVSTAASTTDQQRAADGIAARHGARDARLAARQRSDRDRAGRATGGSGRSYAFRRS